ncbi:hypothetical protein J4463_02805 [Candidatus Pacearchaeota archaeon]|nr:hypothetical protein [Candidatus Pacearchaeota archaeon]
MVKIQINEDLLDFEAPVYMNDEYFKRFCKKIEEITKEEIEIIPVIEKERWAGIIDKQKPRKWKPEELLLLLSPLEHTELKKKLRRSEMSLVLKQGDFVPKFTSWAKNKGYSLQEITSSIIKQYLEESEDEHP